MLNIPHLPKPFRHQALPSVIRAFSTTSRQAVFAPGPKDGPKGNATGLKTDQDGMKPGTDDNSRAPTKKTPNVEGGEGENAHPAKQADPQPEPTRSTGIKGKEEIG